MLYVSIFPFILVLAIQQFLKKCGIHMHYTLIALLLLHSLGACAAGDHTDHTVIEVILHNERLGQKLQFETTRTVLETFTAFKDMVDDTQKGRPKVTLPIHSTKNIAIDCVRDQFRIAGCESSKISAFGDDYDMHEYMRMAEYAGASSKLLSDFVKRGPQKLVTELGPYVLGTKKHTELSENLVKQVFPIALAASTHAGIKKYWRQFFYEKMYENKEFEDLEAAVLEGMDENLEPKNLSDDHRYIKDLPALKSWEESFERKAFCAAHGDEDSLHMIYEHDSQRLPFYSTPATDVFSFTCCTDHSRQVSVPFIKHYFYSRKYKNDCVRFPEDLNKLEEKTSLEYLHLPLLCLLRMHRCLWYNSDHRNMIFDFSEYPTSLTRADWNALAKYSSRHGASHIKWLFSLNDQTNTVPWQIVSTIKADVSTSSDGTESFNYGNVTLFSNNRALLSSDLYEKQFLLYKRASFFEKVFSKEFFEKFVEPVMVTGGLFLVSYFLWHRYNKASAAAKSCYANNVHKIFDSRPTQIQKIVCDLIELNQSLLPGVYIRVQREALPILFFSCFTDLHTYTTDFNAPLLPVQSALKTIQDINGVTIPSDAIPYSAGSSSLGVFLGVCTFSYAFYKIIRLVKYCYNVWHSKELEYIFDGSSLRVHRKFSVFDLVDETHGCNITVKKPTEDPVKNPYANYH